jgi:hypothetical protein
MMRDILQLRGPESVSILDRRKPPQLILLELPIILPSDSAGLLHSFAEGLDEDRAESFNMVGN